MFRLSTKAGIRGDIPLGCLDIHALLSTVSVSVHGGESALSEVVT